MTDQNLDSKARKAFVHYLRTGRWLTLDQDASAVSKKFNPYHDPRNGQFTFGPGGAQSQRVAPAPEGSSRAQKPSSKPAVVRVPTPDAKPSSQIETPAVPIQELGILSARYESSGKRDPGRISSGRGDPGGVSYGTYQLSTKTHMIHAFVASPEARRWAHEFERLKPGTAAFNAKWRAIAARDPKGFDAAQQAFVGRVNYEAAVKKVLHTTKYNLDKASRAVREVTFSVAVQHGRAADILKDAIDLTDQNLSRPDPNYQEALINNIYDKRIKYVDKLRISADSKEEERTFRILIESRYPRERPDALRMLNNNYNFSKVG